MLEMHKQCLLERNGSKQVVWIPQEFAVKDRTLRIKEDGKWTNGWIVGEVFDVAIASDVIQKRERDFKTHRRATDI